MLDKLTYARLAVATLLAVMALGALTPVQAESPQAAAELWAKEMLQTLRMHPWRDKTGSLVALQPLHPDKFPMLDARQRRRIYEWLLRAFGDSARGSCGCWC